MHCPTKEQYLRLSNSHRQRPTTNIIGWEFGGGLCPGPSFGSSTRSRRSSPKTYRRYRSPSPPPCHLQKSGSPGFGMSSCGFRNFLAISEDHGPTLRVIRIPQVIPSWLLPQFPLYKRSFIPRYYSVFPSLYLIYSLDATWFHLGWLRREARGLPRGGLPYLVGSIIACIVA